MSLNEYLEIRPQIQCEVCDNCKAMRIAGMMLAGKHDGYTPCRIENYFSQYLMKTPARNRSHRKSISSNKPSSSKPEKVTPRVEAKPEKVAPRANPDNITTVTALMNMPGIPIHAPVHIMTNHLTGEVYKVDPREVERRYRGREVDMVLKITISYPAMKNDYIIVYNESRDFVAYVMKEDPGFPALKNMIVSKGVPAVPGKKGHFFTKLKRDLRLDIYLDRMTHEAW